ncbi:MAG TPA: hypothetical protein VKA78_17245 [Pyrinomonadaceae bacterium]|nr:hypothetical protein [Pyrinomonadaceae bacterium]
MKLRYRAPAKSMRAEPPLWGLMCRVLTVPPPARDPNVRFRGGI